MPEEVEPGKPRRAALDPYGHLFPGRLDEVAEALDADRAQANATCLPV